VKSFQDYTVFNTINPDTITPKAKKSMPFPLENFGEEISDVYVRLDRIGNKLIAAESNPVNDTKARQERLKRLKYKIQTCIKLIKEVDRQCQELWY
jgi:hypothetical protein